MGDQYWDAESAAKRMDELEAQLAAEKAKVDALMLEYCPNEMSQKQVENWGASQAVVEKPAESAAKRMEELEAELAAEKAKNVRLNENALNAERLEAALKRSAISSAQELRAAQLTIEKMRAASADIVYEFNCMRNESDNAELFEALIKYKELLPIQPSFEALKIDRLEQRIDEATLAGDMEYRVDARIRWLQSQLDELKKVE